MSETTEKEILCNLCGLPCTLGTVKSFLDHRAGLTLATVYGGYHSTPGNGFGALDDCNSYKFSLCEFCLDWLFSRFKVPVTVWDDVPIVWRPAEQRVNEDEWRTYKSEFFELKEKHDKARGQ